MKLKIVKIIYCAYLKSSRFIGYFEDAETAMNFLQELYPTEEKHVEPIFVLGEEKE